MEEENTVKKDLKKWFSGVERVVVAGIGNPIRMDDFIGVEIVRELRGKASDKVYLIECETVPESYIQHIVDFNPSHVLLIDAAVMGLKPGEYRLVKPKHLKVFPPISTHMLPLRVFCEYIIRTTRAKIALLLIEPKQTDFGENLSMEVAAAKRRIIKILRTVLP
ncbi:MAG: hydrogenase 3 maturation endopeptidase HyCI [Candidatus Bathyarchaeia archaeon]